uniref:Uncharacterized protein n=1 Tax=Rhizophora mucronata TaxID=61149 RepID=A0A2P2NPS1_RHIMU
MDGSRRCLLLAPSICTHHPTRSVRLDRIHHKELILG